MILFNFDMQHDHVLKTLNFDLLTPFTWLGVGGWGKGSLDKVFATLLLHFVIPFKLICNMTMFFDLLNTSLGSGMSARKIFAAMLLHS